VQVGKLPYRGIKVKNRTGLARITVSVNLNFEFYSRIHNTGWSSFKCQ